MKMGRQWAKKISYTHTQFFLHRTKYLESDHDGDYKVEATFDKNDNEICDTLILFSIKFLLTCFLRQNE